MSIFNQDFYPTPENIIAQMTWDLDFKGKTVLEPSAGKGDIVDFCIGSGATVLACETSTDLQTILKSKCKLISEDFLKVTSDMISHVDYIIMNPPFSADEKHILHAFEIAPDGCQIVALCNWETIANSRYSSRERLANVIKNYGNSENLGNVFFNAERKTNVEIGLVKLWKPKRQGEEEFDGFFLEEDEEQQFNGLQQYNFVRDIVGRYVGAMKVFDQQLESAKRMNDLTGTFFKSSIALSMTNDNAEITREEYRKELQKSAWNFIFKKMNMDKYSTQGLKNDINKFVEKQTKVPFTMRNIYKMIEIIVGTHSQRMDKALLEVFDKLTNHYHDNRWMVEGWKTNSHYLVNEKFIFPSIFEITYGGSLGMRFGWSNSETLKDFVKALCYLTGKNYDDLVDLQYALGEDKWLYCDGEIVLINNGYGRINVAGEESLSALKEKNPNKFYELRDKPKFGEWFDFGFFAVKGFKKGTGHFKFKDRDVWALFNQNIARIKGYPLPESIKTK